MTGNQSKILRLVNRGGDVEKHNRRLWATLGRHINWATLPNMLWERAALNSRQEEYFQH